MVTTVRPCTCLRLSLRLGTYVLIVWNMCPHGFNLLTLLFLSCVLTRKDICPDSFEHHSLSYEPYVLLLVNACP